MPITEHLKERPTQITAPVIEELLRAILQVKISQEITLVRIESKLDQLKLEIQNVSTSLSEQLDAITASIKADVAAVSAEVSTLLNGVSAGDTITQAQIDALTAIDASLKAIPAAPTPTPTVDGSST